MISETYRNVFFGAASISLLLAAIKHSEYISNNIDIAEEYYFGITFVIVATCLFLNICLAIFSLFILGNLNDFIERMSLNLIGAYQKMRVLAILSVLSFIFFSFSSSICFYNAIFLNSLERKMIIVSVLVTVLQLIHILSMNAIHPDLFLFKWRKELKDFDNGDFARNSFI